MTRVKICGLTNRADVEWAIEYGADAIGFVHEPSSPRCIGETDLSWIQKLPPVPIKVAVFGRVDRPAFAGLFDLVQGSEWESYPEPATKRIHTYRVRSGQRPTDYSHMTVNAAAVLLDAHKDWVFGGTGLRVDLGFAAEFVQLCEKPVILAGGLDDENVSAAIKRVRPFMVDVSSGIEEYPGKKDWDKMRRFIEEAKGA
ncbi:MAG: phosphoribosylanthranilate isomerase [Fimbriimonadaceae bacterium]|nr:phosphoribosylanthranilate isomerase [Fimbriimonadaceae bacterium]